MTNKVATSDSISVSDGLSETAEGFLVSTHIMYLRTEAQKVHKRVA